MLPRSCLLPALLVAGCASDPPAEPGPDVKTETVRYEVGGTEFDGFLAYDAAREGPRPGVLVVHEWWGHNEYARERARMLAEMGYTAFALDMYGDGKRAGHPDDAQKFASEVFSDLDAATARFEAAREIVEAHPTTDPERTAAIGYCFGGGIVLAMARAGVDLAGVVSFHGTLATDTPARPGEVKARILVLNGGADSYVTEEQLAAFRREMEAAGADSRVITYPGARHAFTNPRADALGRKFDMPIAYAPEADRKSWQAMREFFEEIFKGEAQAR